MEGLSPSPRLFGAYEGLEWVHPDRVGGRCRALDELKRGTSSDEDQELHLQKTV